MYTQIMIPLDGSTFSEQALAYSVGAAHRSNATLHLVRVHSAAAPVLNPAAPWVVDAVANGKLRATEAEYIEQLAALPRASGLDVRTALLNGPVVDALEDYIHQSAVDLVIMTTHGRGGLSRVWLGSIADSLVRSVEVPVLLLRPAGAQRAYGPGFALTNVVIPVNGTQFSERVIDHAVALGGLTDVRYTLVQVIAPPVSARLELVPPEDAEFDLLREHALADLEQVAGRMRARGFEVTTSVVVQCQSAAGILEYAMECRADLIAMATHGRAGWARLALGSVADKVLRGTQVPLLLMHPDVASRTAIADLAESVNVQG